MEKAEIENLISEENECLNKIETLIATTKANGNISLAVTLDEQADSILNNILNLRMKLQRLSV